MKPATAAKLTVTALGGLVLAAAAFELATIYPQYRAYRLSLADHLAGASGQASGAEATADLQLAAWLNPRNHTVHLRLAQNQLANNQPQAALAQLAQAGQSRDVNRLKIRILLELGRGAEANAAAVQLAADPAASSDDLVLAGYAAAVRGNTAACSNYMARLSSPEALQSLSRAQAGNIPLAAELLAVGLPKSASVILVKQPVSFERNIMLARIGYQEHTQASLPQARDYAEAAAILDPSSIAGHQLLAAIDRDLDDTAAAHIQDTLANRLIAGRP